MISTRSISKQASMRKLDTDTHSNKVNTWVGSRVLDPNMCDINKRKLSVKVNHSKKRNALILTGCKTADVCHQHSGIQKKVGQWRLNNFHP